VLPTAEQFGLDLAGLVLHLGFDMVLQFRVVHFEEGVERDAHDVEQLLAQPVALDHFEVVQVDQHELVALLRRDHAQSAGLVHEDFVELEDLAVVLLEVGAVPDFEHLRELADAVFHFRHKLVLRVVDRYFDQLAVLRADQHGGFVQKVRKAQVALL